MEKLKMAMLLLVSFALTFTTAYGQWSLTGNGSTNPPTNFLGTTDQQPLVFKVNGIFSGLIDYDVNKANTAFGHRALSALTSGINNCAFGYESLDSNTTGVENTAYGVRTLHENITGSRNTAVGYGALINNTGDNNTAFGLSALTANTSGTYNTGIGYGANNFSTTASYTTTLGYRANAVNLTNATAIGSTASVTASNAVMIGNNAVTSIGGYANWTNFSDGRGKENIKTNVPGLAFISKLNPVTYTLNLDAIDKIIQPAGFNIKGEEQFSKVEIDARNKKEKVVYTGFIAQDVESAAKSVSYDFSGVDVPDNDKDPYGLRYGDFVVPLVKAVQELSAENDKKEKLIEDLSKKIDQLQSQIDAILKGGSVKADGSIPVVKDSYLEQNSPNPFNVDTRIRYFLAPGSVNSSLTITNATGQVIKTVLLHGKVSGEVNINSRELTPGIYFYSLNVNGNKIDTKQMVITK